MKHGDDISLVQITKPFEIQTTPVTQRLYREIMGKNPSYFKNQPDNPVECVSWHDAQDFIKKLNERDSNYTYRLPTEAEWCLAENGEEGDDENAWYRDNSNGSTHPVALKKPNEFGLYDMHGNVWELLEDWDILTSESIHAFIFFDPKGTSEGLYRVIRGGSWGGSAQTLDSGYRSCNNPHSSSHYIGFRLVRTRK